MSLLELVVGLLAATIVCSAVARWLKLPEALVMVVAGLALSAVPGVPQTGFPPGVIFALFFPPRLYAAAYVTSWRLFRDNLRPIISLGVGLVLTLTVVVAIAAYALVPGLTWPTALLLAAMLADPDFTVFGAVAEKLRVPKRIVTILNGESLVEGATSLELYLAALTLIDAGTVSLPGAGLAFLGSVAGGVALGVAAGWLMAELFRRERTPTLATATSLLAPFGVYSVAAALGLSRIVALVAAGLYIGWRSPTLLTPAVRRTSNGVWDTLSFVLTGLIYIPIGVQLPAILARLPQASIAPLLVAALVLSALLVAVRVVWVFPATYLPRLLSLRRRTHDPSPGWRQVLVVALGASRGVAALATAVALPFATAQGAPFPERDALIFVTLCVVVLTIAAQELTLPLLVRRLHVTGDETARRSELEARLGAAQAALARLAALERENGTPADIVSAARQHYAERVRRLQAQAAGAPDQAAEEHAARDRALTRELVGVERATLLALRNAGNISDEILHRIEEELDLVEQQAAG